MHFLSHYYVDRGRSNPYFVLGALIPDIAPHFTKIYNTNIRNKILVFDETVDSIHRGILRHFEVDATFHSSLTFKESCVRAGIAMADQGLDREKYRFWFLSHIVLEVLLDRQLILLNPGLVNEYYRVLSSVDINKLDAYFYFMTSKEEKSKILTNFIRFLEVKFLRHLEKMEGAAEGVIRTVYRATGVAFTEKDVERLIAAFHNIESDIRYSSKKLLEV